MTAVLVYAVAFCVVAVLVYMGRYSGRLRVAHTRIVDAPLAQTLACVSDLRRWPEWSPWLENEADVQTVYRTGADGGASACAWSRNHIEIGSIETLPVRDDGRIEQRLRLKQPFPLRGRGSWRFTDMQGKTQVTSSLRGRVAFTMRAFAPTVQGAIALDFRYGLDRLAARVEPAGAPRYGVSYEGVREIAAVRYAYVEHTGPIANLGESMERAVGDLRAQLAARGLPAGGEALGVYVKTDIKRRTTVCRFGIPIGEAEVDGLDAAMLPAHRAFTARLQGSRAQLEVAWYLLMQRLGAENIQPDLRIAPFERYLDSANREDGNATITELHIAVR